MITLNYSLWSVLGFFDYILTDIEQKDRLYSRQNLPKLEQLAEICFGITLIV